MLKIGIRTTTVVDSEHGKDLIINGSKCWITNGHQADWICLLSNTIGNKCEIFSPTFCESNPHRNKSLICVNLSEPGKCY